MCLSFTRETNLFLPFPNTPGHFPPNPESAPLHCGIGQTQRHRWARPVRRRGPPARIDASGPLRPAAARAARRAANGPPAENRAPRGLYGGPVYGGKNRTNKKPRHQRLASSGVKMDLDSAVANWPTRFGRRHSLALGRALGRAYPPLRRSLPAWAAFQGPL